MSAQIPSSRLLVCSLGNPGARYARTRHSVGHIMLNQLISDHQRTLGNKPLSVPGLNGELYRGKSLLNRDATNPIALFKNGTLMNASGAHVLRAWKWASSALGKDTKLVLLHDDLEMEVGSVQARSDRKHHGHNGIKSVRDYFDGPFYNIRIGIGRPDSRASDDVAYYVLGNIPPRDLDTLKEEAYPKIWELLQAIEENKLEGTVKK
ncbi:peptidyl-tRNA hydrolase [Myxozyma melibiosi]|uniref:Peptidyl-tRNA hydrolase n=1 Tax=Myxozyma melibiosi TaxID=54550 RepID=A0ABR1F8Y1_9ASCO